MADRSATLRGYVDDVDSKIGERYVTFEAVVPYRHHAMVTVTGDRADDRDDTITAALDPFCRGLVEVDVRVDKDGDLFATPSCFRKVAE